MFSHPRFLPLLDCSASELPDRETLESLVTISPLLIPISSSSSIVPLLPKTATDRYVLDDLHLKNFGEGDENDNKRLRIKSIIDSLDSGASKVVTDLWEESIEAGVEPGRLIRRIDLSPNSLNRDFQISGDVPLTNLMIIVDEESRSNGLVEQFLTNHRTSKDSKIFILNTSQGFDPNNHQGKESLNLIPVINSSSISNLGIGPLIELFASTLRTDRPDGLVSTSVVASAPSCTLLGQVFSSIDSIKMSIRTRKATYFSRSRGQIWVKGETSGATQELLRIRTDCDGDALEFQVVQKPLTGFCHTEEISCFGPLGGLKDLESTLLKRQSSSTPGSYTNRLFSDEKLLKAKIMEEAEELCDAEKPEDVAGEMADLIYFALCRCVTRGVSLADVEHVLNKRSLKVTRRKGDSKRKWEEQIERKSSKARLNSSNGERESQQNNRSEIATPNEHQKKLRCRVFDFSQKSASEQSGLLKRPVSDSKTMLARVKPIIDMVKDGGDRGLMEAVQKFDRFQAQDPASLVINAPFPELMTSIPADVKEAIDIAYSNIFKFHHKQLDKEKEPMVVETMEGVVCSRFAKPIDRVGLYVPGGSATLPSTAMMLGIPAQVAGCEFVSIATPARPDGTISPEIMYIASKCGVKQIVKAGGAHAIASLAYGTESVKKVDKIFGPGNQFVTAAKMNVASDLEAVVAIDMPAGPSEVLVIADKSCNPKYVAADLLAQAEHGPDSQVILLAVDFDEDSIRKVESEIEDQAKNLPRLSIVEQSISKSLIIKVRTIEEAFEISNLYGPEHLIVQLDPNNEYKKNNYIDLIKNAGSVFIGDYSPESCGDYASGTNHSLPTSGYSKQFSGVSTLGFMKHITMQDLKLEGLKRLSKSVIRLAEIEGLEGHANSVRVRLN